MEYIIFEYTFYSQFSLVKAWRAQTLYSICAFMRVCVCSYKYPWIFLFKCTYFYHFPNHRFMCMPINFKLFAPSEPPSNKKQPLNAIKNYFLISFQFHKLPKSDGTHTVACSICLFFRRRCRRRRRFVKRVSSHLRCLRWKIVLARRVRVQINDN